VHARQPSWLYAQDVLSHFGNQPRHQLLSFLSQAPGLDSKLIYSLEMFSVLGDEAFLQSVTASLGLRRQVPRECPGRCLSLQEIASVICAKEPALAFSVLTQRHKGSRRLTQIRQEDSFAASQLFFYPANPIAHFLQISPSAVTRLQCRYQSKILSDPYQEALLYQMLERKQSNSQERHRVVPGCPQLAELRNAPSPVHSPGAPPSLITP
jgi:hypothetical protein